MKIKTQPILYSIFWISMFRAGVKKSDQVLARVKNLRELPTLSVVVSSVVDCLQSEKTSRKDLVDLVKKDQVLTARVLRLVNSGFYSRSTAVVDVEKAMHFLGDHTVMALVMGTSVFSQDDLGARDWFDVQDFWIHSLSTAIASEFLAVHLGHPNPTEIFTCGLLHDLGKMALFRADPASTKEVVEKAYLESIPFIEAELDLGLPGHHVVGEMMSLQWQLPRVVRKVQRYHHRDILGFESLSEEEKFAIAVVTLANAVSKRCELGFSGDAVMPELSQAYLDYLDLSQTFTEVLEFQLPLETLRAREALIKREIFRRAA